MEPADILALISKIIAEKGDILKGVKVYNSEEEFAEAKRTGTLDSDKLNLVKGVRNRGLFYYSEDLPEEDVHINTPNNLDGRPLANDIIFSKNGNLYVCTAAVENSWQFSYKVSLKGEEGATEIASSLNETTNEFTVELKDKNGNKLSETKVTLPSGGGGESRGIIYLDSDWSITSNGTYATSSQARSASFTPYPKIGDVGINRQGVLFEVEYIFYDPNGESVGCILISSNALTGFVKFTDYAKGYFTTTKPENWGYGVVKPINGGQGGIDVPSTKAGELRILKATHDLIDARTPSNYLDGGTVGNNHCRPITPAVLDYAVIAVLTNCKIEITDDQKVSACNLLGATKLYKHTLGNVTYINTSATPYKGLLAVDFMQMKYGRYTVVNAELVEIGKYVLYYFSNGTLQSTVVDTVDLDDVVTEL